ncbi:MAG: hypothetical protein JOZ33_06165 [Acidobacteriaceae bacterium]|nr:hypothetical protein [Acidobacteriaceae bacterium]
MFGSFILDVAIGMVFIYLLLSLVASGINEILASIVQSRAANLERGLRSLFSGYPLAGGGLPLVDKLYDHGLIRGLYPDPEKDLGDNSPLSRWSKFRIHLQKLVGIHPGKSLAVVKNPLLLPSYIPSRTFALAMMDILSKSQIPGQTALENIGSTLTAEAAANPTNKAVEAMLALATDAKNDAQKVDEQLQRFQRNLENWYNDAMDRVAGWYKRYTQRVLLIVGLMIAIAFNVDSIRIVHMLWVDRDARQSMANAATEYWKSHQTSGSAVNAATTGQNLDELAKQLKSSVQAFNEVSGRYLLPLGWRHRPSDYWCFLRNHPGFAMWTGFLASVGWLITAGALSLGASFWFDMLNKIMVVRNTVKPQEKSQAEGSKD